MRGLWPTALLAAGVAAASAALAAPLGEINVAASRWGLSRAWASSTFGPGYGPENAVDGRWARRETDRWNSAKGPNQWIVVDLGAVFTLDRVLLRHEGVYAQGDQYNTSGFRLQRGQGPKGPWTDLVPPVRGNHANITETAGLHGGSRRTRTWRSTGSRA
jgi:NedA-like, galactose-binding domain